MRDSLLRDLRHAVRALLRRPLYSAAALSTLALGIGGCSFFFGLLDSVVLRPLPFERPSELVTIWNRYGENRTSSSPPDYRDRRGAATLASLAAADVRSMALDAGAEPRQVQVAKVTSGFFDLLGAPPLRGRAAFPAEDGVDPGRVVVVSERIWREELRGDADSLGRSVRLDGEAYHVQAVLPAGLGLPRGTEVWVPLVFTPEQLADSNRGNESLLVIGRLAPGRTLVEAQAEMEAIAARVIEQVPGRADYLRRARWSAEVGVLRAELFGESAPALRLLMAAMVTLLAIACANLAHLQLAAAAGRERELRLRACLGAGRGRLLRQLLLESGVLALAGGALGLLLSWSGVRVVPLLAPRGVPRIENVALDARSVTFTLLLTLGVAVAFGALPALRASRLAGRIGDRSVSGPRSKALIRQGLVVQEVALAILLLVGAGLFLRSFARLSAIDPGFSVENRAAFRVTLPRTQYPRGEQRVAFASSLLERLRAWPETRSAAFADRLPLSGRAWTGTFYPEGWVPGDGEASPGGDLHVVSDGYFETLGVDLLAGREFEPGDDADSLRVALVDESTARRLFPQGALGRRIGFDDDTSSDEERWTIVGVVRQVRQNELEEPDAMQVYFPAAQWPERDLTFVVRGRLDAEALLARVRHELRTIAPGLPAFEPRTLDSMYRDAVAVPKLQALFLAAFAAVALLLAAIGLHGVLALAASERRGEIGVRMALGASRRGVLAMVLRQGLALTAAGVTIGAAVGFGAARWLESAEYGIDAGDARVFGAAAALVAIVATVAALAPAWRAARVDPVTVLRSE